MTDPTSRRAIIVEDEFLVAMYIEDMLVQLGHKVVASVSTVASALELVRSAECDLAVLDVNLDGELSFAIADILCNRAIPFIFVTGYGRAGLEKRLAGTPTVQKPFEAPALQAAIVQATGSRRGRMATPAG